MFVNAHVMQWIPLPSFFLSDDHVRFNINALGLIKSDEQMAAGAGALRHTKKSRCVSWSPIHGPT